MRLFDRWFARDVACFTGYAFFITLLLVLIHTGARLSSSLEVGSLEALFSRAQNIVTRSLLSAWPIVCTMGFCSAVAHWVGRGKDLIVESAGQPFWGSMGPGFLLAMATLLGGNSALSVLSPEEPGQRATWVDRDSWGAVLAGQGDGLHWIEFRDRSGELEVRRGRAEVVEQLPPSGTAALLASVRPLIGGWERALFLLLAAALMWNAVALRIQKMDMLAVGIPLIGWVAWVKTLGAVAALLNVGEPGGGMGVLALTFFLLGLAGLGAQFWARSLQLSRRAASRV